MRILFLAPQPFFEVRGTPLAVKAMVGALVNLGHQVTLLTFAQGDPVDIPGLRHRRSLGLPVGRVKAGASFAKLVLDLPFMLEAALLLLTRRYDVVHAVEEAALLVAPLTRLFGVPLVSDVDSSIPDQLRYSGFARRGPLPWLAAWLERNALRHSVAAVTVCRSLTDGVRTLAPGLPVFQIEDPPLIDPDAAPPAGAAESLRRELVLGEGPIVLYSGNFESYQGVEILVDAAALVPEATFLMMGGESADIERMRARAATAGGNCVFCGKQPPAELPRFLGAADVLVSPRIKGENTPFKVFTYLAAGKPLVATRIATHTQLLDDSLAALVEPTAAGLADGIRQVLSDPPAAAARAERAKACLTSEYGPARYAEKVARAYAEVESLISGGRRSADVSSAPPAGSANTSLPDRGGEKP
jgi:glycosyltransferase involved in cell wall biosynthesis